MMAHDSLVLLEVCGVPLAMLMAAALMTRTLRWRSHLQ
jgi:hypothetical protein